MIDVADILHAAETGAGVGGDGVGNAVTGKLCAAVSILIQAVNTVMLHVSVLYFCKFASNYNIANKRSQ